MMCGREHSSDIIKLILFLVIKVIFQCLLILIELNIYLPLYASAVTLLADMYTVYIHVYTIEWALIK